jgi:hypothetical protein
VRPQPTPTTTPSTKPEETKTDGKAAAEKSADAPKSLLNEKGEEPKGAPAKYEDFAVPEGFTLDEDVAKDASAIFKKHDLNQAAAQELVDLYVKLTKEAAEQPFKTWSDQQQKWKDEINADPDIGGAKLRPTLTSISKAIDLMGKYADGFREGMDFTGGGNHPGVIRGLNAIAKLVTEGGAVRGNGPSPLGQDRPGMSQPSTAQAIYPHLKSNA